MDLSLDIPSTGFLHVLLWIILEVLYKDICNG